MCRNSGPPLIGRPISFPWHGMRSDIEHNDRQIRRLVDAILDDADAKPINAKLKELEAETALRTPPRPRMPRRRPGFGRAASGTRTGARSIEPRGELGLRYWRPPRGRPEGVDIRSGQGTANQEVAEGSRTNFPSAPASSRDCRLFPIAIPRASRQSSDQGFHSDRRLYLAVKGQRNRLPIRCSAEVFNTPTDGHD